MARYQNMFTQVQLRGPLEAGPALRDATFQRLGKGSYNYWAGKIGAAQIGPIYLGTLGMASLTFAFLAFEIIGLNMFASVGWNPIQFVRQLPWLALEPPGPQWGFQLLVPLAEGGWWQMAGFFMTTSLVLWWLRTFRRARALGMGTHVAWAFAAGILLIITLGFIRPMLMGSWAEAVAVRHLSPPRLDRGLFDPLRQSVLQPVPLPFDRVPVWIDPVIRDARRDDPRGRPLWR